MPMHLSAKIAIHLVLVSHRYVMHSLNYVGDTLAGNAPISDCDCDCFDEMKSYLSSTGDPGRLCKLVRLRLNAGSRFASSSVDAIGSVQVGRWIYALARAPLGESGCT